jgi:hypothetical protein
MLLHAVSLERLSAGICGVVGKAARVEDVSERQVCLGMIEFEVCILHEA